VTYAVIAHYRCAADDADHIRDALLKMRDHTRREPGNLMYVVHTDSEETAFILYEQYVDQAAFAAHTDSEHFAEYILGMVRPKLIKRTVLFGTAL